MNKVFRAFRVFQILSFLARDLIEDIKSWILFVTHSLIELKVFCLSLFATLIFAQTLKRKEYVPEIDIRVRIKGERFFFVMLYNHPSGWSVINCERPKAGERERVREMSLPPSPSEECLVFVRSPPVKQLTEVTASSVNSISGFLLQLRGAVQKKILADTSAEAFSTPRPLCTLNGHMCKVFMNTNISIIFFNEK